MLDRSLDYILKRPDGSTTKMLEHLKTCHPQLIVQENEARADLAAANGGSMKNFVTYGGDFYYNFLYWIVSTFQPVSTCEEPAFRKMINDLNPKCKPLDRKTVFSYMGVQAATVKATIKIAMVGMWFAMTCDHWTSNANVSYLAATAHFINNDWELISLTLSCKEHTEEADAPGVLKELQVAWEAFDLDVKKMVGVTSDTASLMGAFGRLLPDGVPHLYCVDHVLELTTVLHNSHYHYSVYNYCHF